MELRVGLSQIVGACLLFGFEYVSAQERDCGIWGMPCPRGPCVGFTCGDNTKCSGSGGCVCLFGYGRPCTEKSPATISCSDIDECSSGTLHRCPVSQSRCQNSPGGYECVPYCKAGYRNLGTGRPGAALNCQDVDECASSVLGRCRARSVCENTVGSFRCTCSQGYRGDGLTCTDIDECSSENTCHLDATCSNTAGSFTCTCNDGFVGNGQLCVSNRQGVDECATLGPDVCHRRANCINTRGSYRCWCRPGYGGDGVNQCNDIDECALANSCHENATCTNTIGSFVCACLPGLTGDGRQNCTALDGCLEENYCHEYAQCEIINNDNRHIVSLCRCRAGFSGDGVLNCTDINECEALGSSVCDSDFMCNNTIGSFTCTCIGDACTDVNIGTTEIATNDRTLEYLGVGLAILASILTAAILLWLIRRKRRRASPLYEEENGEDNPAVDTEGITIEPVSSTQQDVSAWAPDNTQISNTGVTPTEGTSQSTEAPEQLSTSPATDVPDVLTEASVETIQPLPQANVGDALLPAEDTVPPTISGSGVNVTPGSAGHNVDAGVTSPSTPAQSSILDSTLPVIDEIEVWQGPVSVQ